MVQAEQNESRSALLRIAKNTGWLIGGKGFGAVSSLIYLAILSRSLGVKEFGHFALIFGMSQTMVAIAGFQTWQIIVRFGTPLIAQGRWDAFGRLAIFGGIIDAFGAALGCALAMVVFFGFAEVLELNPRYVLVALAFVCAMLWARVSAPYGIIRALDRFELSVFVGAITPAGRLIAAVIIWLTGPTVERFLFAWAAVEFLTAIAMWFTAWRLRPDVLRISRAGELRRTLDDNPGILRFLWVTYCSTSLLAALQQGPLLAVGYFFGTSAAGIYRMADQLAKGLGKLALLLSDAVYPEVNKQRHSSDPSQFRQMVFRVSMSVISIAVLVVILAMLLGETLLMLIAGQAFAAGGVVLVPLVIAAAFELASVPYEPVLHSVGKPHYMLFARLAAVVLLAVAIVNVASSASVEVAWAVAVVQALEYVGLSIAVALVLRSLSRREARLS